MSRLRRIDCAYCGSAEELTRDHIPPESFFPKPRASNLITVPCCESCRVGWSKDDEYFRAAILTAEQVYEAKQAGPVIDSLLRSIERPSKRGFARMLDRSIEEVQVMTEAGIYLGQAPAFKIDRKRIDRVAKRIVRGLFFHELKRRVPEGYEVLAYIQQFGIAPILERLQGVEFKPMRVVQDGVFCYTYKEVDEDPDSSVWLALFYGVLPVVGFTRKPPELRVLEAL